jgi:hypothetical protein
VEGESIEKSSDNDQRDDSGKVTDTSGKKSESTEQKVEGRATQKLPKSDEPEATGKVTATSRKKSESTEQQVEGELIEKSSDNDQRHDSGKVKAPPEKILEQRQADEKSKEDEEALAQRPQEKIARTFPAEVEQENFQNKKGKPEKNAEAARLARQEKASEKEPEQKEPQREASDTEKNDDKEQIRTSKGWDGSPGPGWHSQEAPTSDKPRQTTEEKRPKTDRQQALEETGATTAEQLGPEEIPLKNGKPRQSEEVKTTPIEDVKPQESEEIRATPIEKEKQEEAKELTASPANKAKKQQPKEIKATRARKGKQEQADKESSARKDKRRPPKKDSKSSSATPRAHFPAPAPTCAVPCHPHSHCSRGVCVCGHGYFEFEAGNCSRLDFSVANLVPAGAPTSGGGSIAVRFIDASHAAHNIVCRFGSKTVACGATDDASVRCPVPAMAAAADIELEFGLLGRPETLTKGGIVFRYEQPQDTAVVGLLLPVVAVVSTVAMFVAVVREFRTKRGTRRF